MFATPLAGDFEDISTRDYPKKPAAVFLGAGYYKTRTYEGKSNITCLPADMTYESISTQPMGPGYAEHLVGGARVL